MAAFAAMTAWGDGMCGARGSDPGKKGYKFRFH